MSQSAILQYLKANPSGLFTAKQLALELGIGFVSASKNLQKLRHWNLVDYEDYPSTKDTLCYRHKPTQ